VVVFFGSIPHADLLKSVARRIVDRRVLTRGGLPAESRRRLERIEAIFAGPPPKVGRDKAA
jgi:hypothetical protein